MSRNHTCDATREMVFNYRRGELSEVDQALFAEGMRACPDCDRYASRLIELLDLAADADAEEYIERPFDGAMRDDLFASILEGIARDAEDTGCEERDAATQPGAPGEDTAAPTPRTAHRVQLGTMAQRTGAPPAVTRHDAFDQDDEEDHAFEVTRPRRGLYLMAAAALLLAAGAAALAWDVERAPLTDTPEDRLALQTPEAPQDTTPATREALPDLAAQRDTPDAVRVFASRDAEWRVEGSAPRYTLYLERGAVLVEFLPRQRESLRVISPGAEVDVVGTVFYVTAEDTQETRVGVLTGEVRVKREAAGRAKPVALRDGQQLAADDAQISDIPQADRQLATSLIDLDAHRRAISDASEARAAADTATRRQLAAAAEADTPAPDATAPRRTEAAAAAAEKRAAQTRDEQAALRDRAQLAMRNREYVRAAEELERLLARLPDSHAERATLRLELARLYMRNLGERERAIHHLRDFIHHHPHDVASPSARRQLCRLLGPAASQEQACFEPTP